MRKSFFKELLIAVVVVPKGLQIGYRLKEGLNSEILTSKDISSLKNENNVIEIVAKRRAKTSATFTDSESADSGLLSDNLEIEKLQVLRIGSQPLRTCNYYQQHDFVELFQKDISRIFNVCSPLYLQGYSLSEVSNLTGFAYTTARDHLVKGGATLRPKNSANSRKISRQKYKSSAAPLFGYVYLEGKLQKDQKEFPVLQIIWNQWKIGQSATNITHYLNDKKIKTRKHREWKRTTILNILQRFENKQIVL